MLSPWLAENYSLSITKLDMLLGDLSSTVPTSHGMGLLYSLHCLVDLNI